MKYQRLSKEQFEALNEEFAKFLASQSITAEQWNYIKSERPDIMEQELDLFSDLIWEGVLQKVKYLDHLHTSQMYLFKIEDHGMLLIAVKVEEAGIDLLTVDGLKWLESHIGSDKVSIYTSSKKYTEDRNADIFDLVEKGAMISEGNLYEAFQKLL